MANLLHGTEVRYCHEGAERRAQVTEVHPTTGEVHGIAVYAFDPRTGDHTGVLEFGVPMPKPSTEPSHRITHGHFWK